MPVLIKLHRKNGSEFYLNASKIVLINMGIKDGADIWIEGDEKHQVIESPETIDRLIDKQTQNLLHG